MEIVSIKYSNETYNLFKGSSYFKRIYMVLKDVEDLEKNKIHEIVKSNTYLLNIFGYHHKEIHLDKIEPKSIVKEHRYIGPKNKANLIITEFGLVTLSIKGRNAEKIEHSILNLLSNDKLSNLESKINFE